MINEDDFKSAFIAKLAGITEAKTSICAHCSGTGTITEPFNESEIRWDSGSRMARTIDFPDGSISNAIVRYYRKDKALHSETEYKDCKKHGKSTKFFKTGQPMEESVFEDNKKISGIEYFISGETKAIKPYHKGKLHGIIEHFTQTSIDPGHLFKAETYTHGTQSGLTSRFDKFGNKVEDILYANGYHWLSVTYIGGKGTLHTHYNHYERIKKFNDQVSTKYGTHILKYKGGGAISEPGQYEVIKKG